MMRYLVITFLLPVVLVLGKPPGGQNWSNEQENFILEPQAKPLPTSIPTVVDLTKSVPNPDELENKPDSTITTSSEPTFSEVMKMIDDSLNEIETSQIKKQKPRISTQDQVKYNVQMNPTSQSPASASTTDENADDNTSSAESEESTEISTTELSSEFARESIEDNSDDNQTIASQANLSPTNLNDITPLKTYAEKYYHYTPVTTGIPDDSSSEETTTDNDNEEQANKNIEHGDLKSKPEETMTDDEYEKTPEPIEQKQNTVDHSDMSGNNDEEAIQQLHSVPITYNDMMDKVIFNIPESQESQTDETPAISSEATPTQNPHNVKYHFFFRPLGQSDEISSPIKPTEPSLVLLPPRPDSALSNDWNMYPGIPERQSFPESMKTQNPDMEIYNRPHAQNIPVHQVLNSNPQTDYYQYQPTMRMQMQIPQMNPYLSQPYFNYQRTPQIPQMYPQQMDPQQMYPQQMHPQQIYPQQMYSQQMYPENTGLGFYGDYFRSPFWTRPSPVHSRPSYWDSYRYNNNNAPLFSGMSASQYYY